MTVTLIDYTQNAVEKLIYTKNTRVTLGKDTRNKVVNMTDEEKQHELEYIARTVPSSWEFVTYTFEIIGVTRAFTHQLVRTRTGSYAQQAQRVNKMENFTYETGPTISDNKQRKLVYDHCMADIQRAYSWLVDDGAAVQDARGVLPTNIHTNIIAQYNLRALSDLVRKRWTARVQDEYRSVVVAMVEQVLIVHPWAEKFLFSDKVAILKELENLISLEIIDREDTKLQAYKLIDLLRKE
jgi:flavin-dependent thymidylate synthase